MYYFFYQNCTFSILMCSLGNGNNYKNSAKLQSFFLKDRRKLSIYRRFRNISFHTNGRGLKLLFFLVTKM